jgi:hypothetical protein
MAQFNNLETTQKTIYIHFDWRCFVLLIAKFSGVISNSHFQPTPFLVLSYVPSLTLFICPLCLYFSFSYAYSPLYFYMLPFHINSLLIFTSGIIE